VRTLSVGLAIECALLVLTITADSCPFPGSPNLLSGWPMTEYIG